MKASAAGRNEGVKIESREDRTGEKRGGGWADSPKLVQPVQKPVQPVQKPVQPVLLQCAQ